MAETQVQTVLRYIRPHVEKFTYELADRGSSAAEIAELLEAMITAFLEGIEADEKEKSNG